MQIIIFFSVFLSAPTFAQSPNVCVNGAPPHNQELIKSFDENQDPLKMAFLENRDGGSPKSSNISCDNSSSQKSIGFFASLTKAMASLFTPIGDYYVEPVTGAIIPAYGETKHEQKASVPPPLHVKKECLESSMKMRPNRQEYACTYPKGKKGPHKQSRAVKLGKAVNAHAQCFNHDMLDYMQFAVNKAIDCISGNDPVDSRYIFKKINTESCSDFSIAWGGGKGLTQITSYALNEMAGPKGKGNKHILKEIAASDKKSCEPFKEIAQHDLESKPSIGNLCDWVSPGDGLARNLLYAIGYHVHMRDLEVIPALKKHSPKLAQNKDIVNSLTTMTFGREGTKGMKGLLSILRISDATDPDKFLDQIEDKSLYVSENDNKQQQFLCIMKGIPQGASCDHSQFSEEEMAGDTCVFKP